jgi:hypothetical protein
VPSQLLTINSDNSNAGKCLLSPEIHLYSGITGQIFSLENFLFSLSLEYFQNEVLLKQIIIYIYNMYILIQINNIRSINRLYKEKMTLHQWMSEKKKRKFQSEDSNTDNTETKKRIKTSVQILVIFVLLITISKGRL